MGNAFVIAGSEAEVGSDKAADGELVIGYKAPPMALTADSWIRRLVRPDPWGEAVVHNLRVNPPTR